MIKNKSFTLQTQKSGGWAKFQEWNQKWNKIMAGVFSVLVFGLLFAIVIVNNTTTENSNQADYERSDRWVRASALDENMCEVICYASQNLTECVEREVERIISKEIDCTSVGYGVVVASTNFSDGKISHGWLRSTEFITKLTIQDNVTYRYIKEIEPGAFNDCTFRSVLNFELRDTSVTELSEGVLHGLNNLKSLFLNQNREIRLIDENALDPIYQLDELRIENQGQLEYLRNITGKREFKHLHTLMLFNNNLGRIINSETFTGCTRVVTLNLTFSRIEAIGASSFDPMAETIEMLDLSGNFLTHLPSNLLANMIRPTMKFYLSNNLWNCDCTSLELIGYAINHSILIQDSPLKCETPAAEEGKEMKNVSSIECMTSPVITLPPTTASSAVEPNLDRLTCYDHTIPHISDYIDLGTAYQSFFIKQLEIGKVSIQLHHPDSNLAMLIINNVDDEVKCQYNIQSEMIFDDLNPHNGHAFCLINKTSYTTSPKNCVPFHFHDTKSIWSHDEIIIALVCSIVLALVLGILIGWLLNFRYQRFFKSKDSLELTSEYHPGKLSMGSNDTRIRLRRSISENSLASCKSYITAVAPSPFEIIHWKLRKNAMNDNHIKDYFVNLEYDNLPPPLPPHPNRRQSDKTYESIVEPVYTCTSEIVPYKITYMK